MKSVSVCLGRFQPFHLGHHALINRALEESSHVVVCIGSALRARTPRNPFTWQERRDMIQTTLSEEQGKRVTFVPLRDYFNRERWRSESFKKVSRVLEATQEYADTPIRFLGERSRLSNSTDVTCSRWQYEAVPRHENFDGSAIRQTLFQEISRTIGSESSTIDDTISLACVASSLPPGVSAWLEKNIELAAWSYLIQEWRALKGIAEAWSHAPFAPTFVTVDAVVQCDNKVLLIRRGKCPGEGLWALPGGFIEQHEPIQDAVFRELYEETRIDLGRKELGGFLVDSKVFDHPERSQFGRVITHGHYFNLGLRACPAVLADDDASAAQWVPIADLCQLEDQFHDDHFLILDHFLKLLD